MSTQRISTFVFDSSGGVDILALSVSAHIGWQAPSWPEPTWSYFAKKLPVHGSQAADHLISSSCYSRPEVSQPHFASIQLFLHTHTQKKSFYCAWKYFICSFWVTSKTQSSFNLASFSTSLNYFCKASNVARAISFLWTFIDSCKCSHFLSHLISTGISQEYPSFFAWRQDLIWL